MRTIYQTVTDSKTAEELAHDFSEAFQIAGENTLEIVDMDAAFNLDGAVFVYEDGDAIFLHADGKDYLFYEA